MTTRERTACKVKPNSDVTTTDVAVDTPARKPAPVKNPKPTVGYISVSKDWDPRAQHDRLFLWNAHPTLAAAEAARAHSDWLGCEPQMIVQVNTTFTIVDDGGRDG